MRTIRYFDGQRVRGLALQGIFEGRQQAASTARGAPVGRVAMRPQARGDALASSVASLARLVDTRFRRFSESQAMVTPVEPGETAVIPTETLVVTNARRTEVEWLRNSFGMLQVAEGSHGKVLLRAPDGADDAIGLAAEAGLAIHERPGPSEAHPNFLRVSQQTPQPAVAPGVTQWGLDSPGQPGLIGADTHALATWTISRGDPSIRVAVLDEGVDTGHPNLSPAVVAERDFVDANPTAMPDGNDAHGTACAGIVASRDVNVSGLAPDVSLVAIRIAKSSGEFWIFDDFDTADAIDWAWDDAKCDVLSNSWGGGPPVPVITDAITRARVDGRKGKGAVVCFAAGNEQGPVSYPGTLPGVLTVGASNEWDRRKTRTSQDGETWWGSNYGQSLNIMAPGVHILTTDISGNRGYSGGDIVGAFNGTSAATPFAAAAAALSLSVNPALGEARVREILQGTVDPLTSSGNWSRYTGYGRVNAFRAVWQARRG